LIKIIFEVTFFKTIENTLPKSIFPRFKNLCYSFKLNFTKDMSHNFSFFFLGTNMESPDNLQFNADDIISYIRGEIQVSLKHFKFHYFRKNYFFTIRPRISSPKLTFKSFKFLYNFFRNFKNAQKFERKN
jgi:hypothetical protein